MGEDTRHRLEQLERRVSALESRAVPTHGADTARTAEAGAGGDERSWLLDQQRRVYPGADVVSLGGTAQVGTGTVQWQWSRPAEYIREHGFSPASVRLSALAHPVRLALLQSVLDGVDTAAGLAELEGMGTSGQVYHHLNQLAAGGWLTSTRRGHWHVPPERVIPLLTIIMAATD